MTTATEDTALQAMRAAMAKGKHEERQLVKAGTEALIKEGVNPETARVAAQLVFNANFKNWAGVL